MSSAFDKTDDLHSVAESPRSADGGCWLVESRFVLDNGDCDLLQGAIARLGAFAHQ
jgi:hypothetical protein